MLYDVDEQDQLFRPPPVTIQNRSTGNVYMNNSYTQFPSESSIQRQQSNYILTKRLLDQMNSSNYFSKNQMI